MLKSLEIQGFKSFPERTELLFHEGITAIVGPNGAGKSNITDAIRWALGEQSAKSLRGSRMEDVIFSGTAQRRAVSFAEVTLTLDNSSGLLPIDYETVLITRRYYRSGESEYLINKTPCRLRDVNELLMDTGIGLDGYSIIGQGKVDEILSSRSEDRRAVFEEASGIVQFRTRKEEALRKLRRSEQNLVRVDDLLAELNDRAVPLAKQADDARSHLDLALRFKRLDAALILRQIANLELQQAKRADDLELTKLDLEAARVEQDNARVSHAEVVELVDGIESRIDAEQVRFNELSVIETEKTGLDALYREKLAASKKNSESLMEEQNRLTMQVMAFDHELTGRASRRESLIARKQRALDELKSAEEALTGVEQILNEILVRSSEVLEKRDRLSERVFSLLATHRERTGERQALGSRRDHIRHELDVVEDDLAKAAEKADRLRKEVTSLDEAIVKTEREAANAHEDVGQRHLDADAIEASLNETISEIQRLRYEAETLERLESSFEGYQRPVQLLMQRLQHAGDNKGEGIYGPLGSLLTVPEDLTRAVEVALGASTHNIVCDTSETAKEQIEWLRRTRGGRITFLPVQSLESRPVDRATLDKASRAKGWIGVASELVSCDLAIQPALRFTLGRTLIVETLDDAVSLSDAIHRSHTIVTRDGDVVHRGGSMTGGTSSKKTAGVLGRPARIREIGKLVESLEDRTAELGSQLEIATEALKHAGAKEESLLEELADLKRRHLRLSAELDAEELAYERFARTNRDLKDEAAVIDRRVEEISAEMSAIEIERESVAAERDEAALFVMQFETENIERAGERDICRDRVTHLKVSIDSIDEAILDFDSMTTRTGSEKEHAEMRLKSVGRELEEQNSLIEKSRKDLEENRSALELVAIEREESQKTIVELMEKREEESARQRQWLETMTGVNDTVSKLTAIYERQTSECARNREQIDDQLNRLWETHGLTRIEAENDACEITSMSKAQSERAELKRRIDQLGPINHNAVAEYEALTERIEYMTAQRDDIEKAGQGLESVIRDLDRSMREQFSKTFEVINRNFSQVFSELFSGGQAEIVLEGDEDVLLADIAIRAQPPGKRLQRLSLLSGGERCLTAIALLFAILKLKPAPFCVFDEVESALDDANVQRFTDYVRRYAWSMQFILVTHRKGTMEAADRLYGVTMQERGISRVLSMKLSSALSYGE
ncbi:MAG TPA: chromosome segregation protein SMC [Clostridiaceae bacterium]|jgi:chromosome segregation protein|nr:chromosome segregation protein SMC [Clostridiaceae bacterium]